MNDTPEVQQYTREKFRLTMISMAIGISYAVVMGIWGGLYLDQLVQPHTAGNRWLELFAVAGLFALGSELLSFPLSFYSGFVVEHKYGLSTQTLGGYMWKWLKMNALTVPLGGLLLAGLYFILWRFTAQWWLWAACGSLFISVIIGRLFPLFVPLFYKVTPLEDEVLVAKLKKIAEGTGLTISNVSRFNMGKETRKANAFLAGMGSTKHVMLADTLLDGFSHDEIEVVFAHEVGHYVHSHVPKGIVLSTVATLASFLVANLVLVSGAVALGHTSFTAPSALPLFLLVLGVFSFIIGPIEKAVSRYFERQSDWYALNSIRSIRAYKSAFSRLAEMNKSELDPPSWKVLMFHTHPPIKQRLTMADDWASVRK